MTPINNNKNINVRNISFGQKPEDNKSFDNTLSTLKDNMIKRCEYEVPEYGDFAIVKETLPNKDEDVYSGNISLICEPSEDNPKKRYLSYNQLNPQNRKGLSSLIASGTKEDILEALNDENFVNNIKQDSERMSRKMQDMKW